MGITSDCSSMHLLIGKNSSLVKPQSQQLDTVSWRILLTVRPPVGGHLA